MVDSNDYRKNLENVVLYTKKSGGTDIFLTSGVRPEARIGGVVHSLNLTPLNGDDVVKYSELVLREDQRKSFESGNDVDFGVTYADTRLRGRISRAVQGPYISLRIMPDKIIPLEEIGFPNNVYEKITKLESGLILVTGVTGSGKSTTLASLIDRIRNSGRRILTVEDPIEYIHQAREGKGTVIQREVPVHTPRFHDALRGFLRENPDVIMVGEIRDYETAIIALNAADTGHLVLSTLHTPSAAETVQRITNMSPPQGSNASFPVSATLASSLTYVLSQKLVPRSEEAVKREPRKGKIALAMEVMKNTSGIRNNIGKMSSDPNRSLNSIENAIKSGAVEDMILLDDHLRRLQASGEITSEIAIAKANNQDEMRRTLEYKELGKK